MSKKKPHQPYNTPKPTLSAAPIEEYRPSENADKYNNISTPRYSYKIVAARNDYIKLQEDVTKLLNDGWSLAGGVATSLQSDAYGVVAIYTQAVYRLS
jgi:hypothetical protein